MITTSEVSWCGGNCVDTGHNIVWIIWFFCMNSLFYFILEFCQIIKIAFQNAEYLWKWYSKILLVDFNTTIDFMFSGKLWLDNKFINKSDIPIPNIMLKYFSTYLESTEIWLKFLIDKLYSQYRHNYQLWYKFLSITL